MVTVAAAAVTAVVALATAAAVADLATAAAAGTMAAAVVAEGKKKTILLWMLFLVYVSCIFSMISILA